MSNDQPRFCLLTASAVLPVRGSDLAAGFDLFSSYDVRVPASDRVFVDIGVGMLLPRGHYGHILPRSGLAKNFGITILGGVIDEDYRGTMGVILLNTSKEDVVINRYKAIAQLVIVKNNMEPAVQISPRVFLERETSRGEGGFGSTDYKDPRVISKKVKFFDWNPVPPCGGEAGCSCLSGSSGPCNPSQELLPDGKEYYKLMNGAIYGKHIDCGKKAEECECHLPNGKEVVEQSFNDSCELTDDQFEKVLSSTLSE